MKSKDNFPFLKKNRQIEIDGKKGQFSIMNIPVVVRLVLIAVVVVLAAFAESPSPPFLTIVIAYKSKNQN